MQEITGVLLMFAPLLVILWLANFADRRRAEGRLEAGKVWAALAYGLLAALYLALIGFGLLFSFIGVLAESGLAAELGLAYEQMGLQPKSFFGLGLGMWAPSLLGLLLLLPPVRRLIGRLLRGVNPASTTHAVALSFGALVLVNLFATVGFGINNLATLIEAGGSDVNMLPSLWVQELTFALMALIGVGWLSRLGLGKALTRLAVVIPRPSQALLGVVLGVLLAGLMLAAQYLLSRLGVTTDADVEKLTEQLIGPLTQSALGVVTLGVAAGLGEETLFRGALQPRFGLLFTSLLFALLHSTYGFSLATALVFLVGSVLGLVRQRTNTSTTILLHAAYNMTLGVISYMGWLQNV